MSAPTIQFLPVGLSGSGKSTFAAALWHVVERGGVEGAMSLLRLEGDTKYLNEIRSQWLAFERVVRTTGPAELTRMTLVDRGESDMVDLIFPDLPGEVYNSQWEHRGWSAKFEELAQASSGLLLFLHPESGGAPTLINEVSAAIRSAPDEAANGATDGQTSVPLPEWTPERAPAQTKVVDVLQHVGPVVSASPVPVALIVSAWDVVELAYSGVGVPSPWGFISSSEGYAQLAQYLRARQEDFEFRTFGVSAQGGDLDDTDVRGRLQSEIDPSGRIVVTWEQEGELVRGHDITEPIRWLKRRSDGDR